MNTEYRIDIDVELTRIAGTRDFVKEVDDFVYGGYVDYIRRDATGCYVMMNDAWIPVADWFDAHKFPGARDLTHIARYFYNLGRREATQWIKDGCTDKERICLESVFPELAESEDERIRKSIIRLLQVGGYMPLEDKEKAFAYLEKQKDASKAIEAVDRIDKYIDEHTANAHDMDDSNPDKKYYSGVDDTLSDIAGILISVYSEEKQKSNIEKLREISTPADEDWFEIEKKWEAEDNEDLRPFISVKFASNAKVIDGKRFAVFTWERFKEVALELINRGEKQKPAAWSEEDERMVRFYEADYNNQIGDMSMKDVIDMRLKFRDWLVNRLKSLRPAKDCSSCAKHLEGYISGRSDAENKLLEQFGALITPEDELRIKPRWKPSEVCYGTKGDPDPAGVWKPSEEQMDVLNEAVGDYRMEDTASCEKTAEILESLYNDLKKLM